MLNLDTRDDQEALNYCIYNFKDEFNTKIDIEKKIFYNFPFLVGKMKKIKIIQTILNHIQEETIME